MNRRFVVPHVVEIGPIGAIRTVRPAPDRTSQRALVRASLLRRPDRGGAEPRS